MNIKKEYEKFFERKKNDLCVHDAEDVIAFAKHYQALQLQQTGVIKSVCKHCNNKLCDSQTFNQQCFKCGKKPL